MDISAKITVIFGYYWQDKFCFHVALSRVKCKKDIRLFLHHGLSGKPDIEDLLFIDTLKPDKSINAFFEGYKYDNTKWNATDALEKFNQN